MNDKFEKMREKTKIRSTHEFKDEFGNVIERRFFNKDLELRSYNKYEYNQKNLLIKEIRYTKEDEVRYLINYRYDENDNLIEYFAYDSKGKPSYRKAYKYKRNKLISERGYNLGSEFRYRTLYFYDNDGYKIIEQHFNAENKLNFVSVFERNGDLFEIISPKGDSEIKISDKNVERTTSNPYPYMTSVTYKTCEDLDDVEDQYKFEYFDEE